jgi:hypothetical protein
VRRGCGYAVIRSFSGDSSGRAAAVMQGRTAPRRDEAKSDAGCWIAVSGEAALERTRWVPARLPEDDSQHVGYTSIDEGYMQICSCELSDGSAGGGQLAKRGGCVRQMRDRAVLAAVNRVLTLARDRDEQSERAGA